VKDVQRALPARTARSGRPYRVSGRPAGTDSARPARRHPANGNNISAMPRRRSARLHPALARAGHRDGHLPGRGGIQPERK
jgi:hypothetical protein